MLIRKLFPLNRCRRLCGDIIHNPIDALAFIDNSCRNRFQYFIWNPCKISCHEICSRNATQCQCIIISSAVTHNANRTHIGQNRKILVDAPV